MRGPRILASRTTTFSNSARRSWSGRSSIAVSSNFIPSRLSLSLCWPTLLVVSFSLKLPVLLFYFIFLELILAESFLINRHEAAMHPRPRHVRFGELDHHPHHHHHHHHMENQL
ncbi:hypothetical protein AA313_de0202103 [Arthrobotrys entomopaga]|nr:hypothetical protein AA313_de0202103 [Arthrobotrys entomopaga]